ncbi:glycosyltransferase family 2 protein [Candidatus Woesearchaeota archaeon]|nr:glycosyltransferase family 2 protein [Candidatus Woesearchaeota archaeon]
MIVITIPAYNEEKTLPKVLDEIKGVMKNYYCKILVIDDGSSDKTVEVARKNGVIVVSNPRNLGLALTFKKEMEECLKLNADVIVHTDADGQYPAKYIPQLIKEVQNGYDLVLGSRFGKGDYSGSFMKRLGNIAFAKTFSNLLKVKITDTTTGFRAFTKEVAKINLINKFTYTQEQLIKASLQKFRIKEIPITTRVTRDSRLFKSPWQYAFKAWINIFRIYRDYNPLGFFGKIGIYFILIGVISGSYLLYNFLAYGRVGHIPLTILTALIFLMGIQIILFGFLADMNRN